MFPDTLYISDPVDGLLYSVENDVVTSSMNIVKEARAILVCQNMADIYTVNRTENTITRIHNGESMGDIPVGKTPYGICEDINGKIYVTNYGDSTVTVIENGKVSGLPIPVSAGPRGIVADYYGNIWVACFLTNTVVKIVNRTVVDEIQVAYNPEGITCTATNNIWVACSGSNAAVKITNGVKKLTVSVGRCPVAIVADKKGNIFTANYEDDTVTMIATSEQNKTATIAVGDGPTAIAVNTSNLIYVTSNLSGEKVYKINPSTQQVIDKIQVCKSQCAFGDFTGCAAFNVFFPNGRNQSGLITENAVSNVIQALNPTFYITEVDENKTQTTFKVDSDLLDLSKFDHFTLNGVKNGEDGSFTLTTEEIGDELKLIGYFDDNNDPIVFTVIKYNNTFTTYFGLVDSNYENYMDLKTKVVDFNRKDVVTTFIEQPTDGHVFALIPTRVLETLRNGLMVQGDYNIPDNWSLDISFDDEEDPRQCSHEVVVDMEANPGENYYYIPEWDGDTPITVTSNGVMLTENDDWEVEEIEDSVEYGTKTYNTAHILKLNNMDKVVDEKVVISYIGNRIPITPADQKALSIKNNIFTAAGFSESKQEAYTLFINNYITNASEKWMFNFFNTLD